MSKKPLLIFPSPTKAQRTNKPPGRGSMRFPDKQSQIAKHGPKITELDTVLANQTASLQYFINNIIPEMVLVLETAGEIDAFFKAVQRTPGMEFLAEFEAELEADQEFYIKDKEGNATDKPIDTRFYLTMTNQRALQELLKYWKKYQKEKKDQDFKHGTTKFRTLFEQLKDIRPYGVQDRIRDTGLKEYIDEMKSYDFDYVRFEIELAYKEEKIRNTAAYNEVISLLGIQGGFAVLDSRIIIPEIGYHAFIAQAPIASFDDLTENTNVLFLKSQQIMFFRPVGQSILRVPVNDEALQTIIAEVPDETNKEPVLALFDGMPLENHQLLRNRLIVDDPDEFANNYLSNARIHGTSMASLILHGDLSAPSTVVLDRPVYVRPIMKLNSLPNFKEEALPDDRLPLDLIHRAVLRMKVGENGNAPTAPYVRFINLSIGDSFRPFHFNISSWAKLLDWLAHEFDLLFIISAGNYVEQLVLNVGEQEFDGLSTEEIEDLVLQEMVKTNFSRKILTPSESINNLTVGAAHQDYSNPGNLYQRKDVIDSPELPSPMSRIGFGYRKSIKPEILMAGGRKLYRKAPMQPNPDQTILRMESFVSAANPPGSQVAMPSHEGRTDGIGYLCGTSNSAALTSRLAVQLYNVLTNLTLDDGLPLDSNYLTVLIKSLLVHSAGWGKGSDKLLKIVKNQPGVAKNTIRRNTLPYLGYGNVDPERILYCTDKRVTLLGYGALSKGNAHLYSFPLPTAISQKNIRKRLTVTLAYHSPLNFKTRKYRSAHLYFDNPKGNGHLELKRLSYDFNAAQSGTVQHDIMEGDKADVFVDGDSLNIKVNCREDASELGNATLVKYGLAVTLEIAENVDIQIYEEIQQRLRTRIRPGV